MKNIYEKVFSWGLIIDIFSVVIVGSIQCMPLLKIKPILSCPICICSREYRSSQVIITIFLEDMIWAPDMVENAFYKQKFCAKGLSEMAYITMPFLRRVCLALYRYCISVHYHKIEHL